MALQLTNEDLMTLAQASREVENITGNRPAPSTIWRWIREGRAGVHLEHVRIGRKVFTSARALWRFFEAVTKVEQANTPTADQFVNQAHDEADAECDAAGL